MYVSKPILRGLALASAFISISAAAPGQTVTAPTAQRGNDCNNNGIPDGDEVSGNEWAELLASDAATSDSFGNSVSLSGNLAVIGAYGDDNTGPYSDSGSAYVFRYDGSTWVELAKLTASDATSKDFFGISVSVSGDVAVIGANKDDDAGDESGSAYIFQKPAGGWVDMTETAKLTASDAEEWDRFGVSVSLSGDVAVIGARDDDDGGSNSGSAYIYQKPAGGWVDMTQTAKLTASDAAESAGFGNAVSISGNVVVIGAYGDDDGASNSGSAYIFQKPAGGWATMTETAKLTATAPSENDGFGGSVSVSGAVAVIGATGDDAMAADAGAAYIFHEPAGGWVDMTQTTKLLASDGAYHEVFGSAVSVSGDLAVIGASWDDDAGNYSGSAYVFGRNTGGANHWGQIAKLTASDAMTYDKFGRAVSVSGGLAVIGAHAHNHQFGDAGAAYVFALGSIDCNTNDTPDECDIASGFSLDCQANGIPDECELGACCLLPADCADDQTQADCLTVGGVFRGPCSVCPTQSVDFFPEPGGQIFVHSIGPPAGCPPARHASRGAECLEPPDVFIDAWVSPEDQSRQTMCHNFGIEGSPAIPADFFADGSEPFTGVVCLRGVPLGPNEWGDFGQADTLIARAQDPFDRCDLPSPGNEVTVSIDVVALNLESVAPMTVIVNGQPEDWDVMVDLSEFAPPSGSLTAIKAHCSGGTYTSVLNVQPRFTFTKVDDPADERELDTGLEGISPIQLVQNVSAPWVSITDPELGVTGDPCSDFHAGIEETDPPPGCDCNANLVHDVCDTDCNANAVPDECDPPGDFEPDGDIDLIDLAEFAVCFSGSCAAPPCDPPLYTDECCVIADFDHDGDVSLDDLANFVSGLNGP